MSEKSLTCLYAAYASARDRFHALHAAYMLVQDDFAGRYEARDAANAAWDMFYDCKVAYEVAALAEYADVIAEAEAAY